MWSFPGFDIRSLSVLFIAPWTEEALTYHCYADDAQIYFPHRSGLDNLDSLFDCLDDIKFWMGYSFLKLNENKTGVIIFGPPTASADISTVLDPLAPYIKPAINNLGVFFDSE